MAGTVIKKRVCSTFERFWIDEINKVKIVNGSNSNKLRFYSTLKGSFSREPYIDLVQSRNQRSFLSRLRCSAHNLEIEKLRYSRPPVPATSRICKFCTSCKVGDERHFLLECDTFSVKRACFMGKMSSIIEHFSSMSNEEKLKRILCPNSTAALKVVNKFIRIMFIARDKLSEGLTLNEYPTRPANIYPCTYNFDDFRIVTS